MRRTPGERKRDDQIEENVRARVERQTRVLTWRQEGKPWPSIDTLTTFDGIRQFIDDGYEAAIGDRLPSAVAEPGLLMEHAVMLAGESGLTLGQMRAVFGRLGQDRFDKGMATMRAAERITETREVQPNRVGRPRHQVVFGTPND